MSATNSAVMKQSNRNLILNIIRKKPSSRAEIAHITGLTRAAVTMIVDDLIKAGAHAIVGDFIKRNEILSWMRIN